MATEKKGPSRNYPLRIPAALYDRIQVAAETEERSMNWKIVKCLEQCFPEGGNTTPSGASLTGETRTAYDAKGATGDE